MLNMSQEIRKSNMSRNKKNEANEIYDDLPRNLLTLRRI